MNRHRYAVCFRNTLLCACVFHAVCAWAADSYAEQRDRIASDRAAANARFAEQERDCKSRFVVTSCTDAALKERRATLNRLHQEQLILDDQKRRDAAAVRREEIRTKAEAQDARASDVEPSLPRERTRNPPQPRPVAPLKSDVSRAARTPRVNGSAAANGTASATDQRALERRNEEKFEANLQAAKKHREEVDRRNADRAAKGKLAAPLPVPPASGASAP